MSVVERAFLILQDLSLHRGETSLSQVARRTGLPKSTTHRLLAELEAVDAVERDGDRYRLGPVSRLLGQFDRHFNVLRRAVMPCLVELYEDLGASVSLAVLQDCAVTYLVTLYGPHQAEMVQRTGMRAPAHCTAAGKALVAFAPALAARCGRDIQLSRLTDHTITARAQFGAELYRIRREGVAYNREEYVPGLVGVAAPIMVNADHPIAAITAFGPSGGFDFRSTASALRRGAHITARRLAHRVR